MIEFVCLLFFSRMAAQGWAPAHAVRFEEESVSKATPAAVGSRRALAMIAAGAVCAALLAVAPALEVGPAEPAGTRVELSW